MTDEMYCIECHGRGLDSNDRTCRRCGGTGIEPDYLQEYIDEELALIEES